MGRSIALRFSGFNRDSLVRGHSGSQSDSLNTSAESCVLLITAAWVTVQDNHSCCWCWCTVQTYWAYYLDSMLSHHAYSPRLLSKVSCIIMLRCQNLKQHCMQSQRWQSQSHLHFSRLSRQTVLQLVMVWSRACAPVSSSHNENMKHNVWTWTERVSWSSVRERSC